MAYTTESSYTGNGSTTEFLVTFPFLESTDIKARVNGVDTSAFTVTGTTVTFNTAPPNTQAVLLYRNTDIDQTKVVFHAGSSIRAQDLNNTSKQLLYAIQEEEQSTGGVAFVTGNKGQITVNTANSWVINNGVVAQAMMAANSIDSDQYVDGSIDRVHLAADIVDGSKIADDSINSEHYVDASIDHAHLSNDCIDGDNIQNDVINSEHYAAASIDNEHLADDAVNSDEIADGAVDLAHLSASGTKSSSTYLRGDNTWADIGNKVLTFATANTTSSVTGSEDTWVDTGLTLNITPKSTSSTILVTGYIYMFGKPKADSSGSHSGKFRLRLRVQPSGGSESTVGEEMLGTFGATSNSTYYHYVAEKEWQFVFHEEYANSSTTQKTFHIECEEQDLSIIEVNRNAGRSFINAWEVV